MTSRLLPKHPGHQSRVRSPRARLLLALKTFGVVMIEGAIGAGLGRLRPRSGPGRLEREGAGFIALVRAALKPRSPAFDRCLRTQVHAGAFAAASPTDIPRLFALWREVLLAVLTRPGSGPEAQLLRHVLASLELRVTQGVRRDLGRRIDVVALCASAGGLAATARVLAALTPELPVTVLVLLHTSSFNVPFAWRKATRLTLIPAVDGAPLLLGCAYVAPPGRHLQVAPGELRLLDTPKVRFVRPSADVLLASAARVLGPRLASVVLTGTGRDGAAGSREVRAQGGVTFAQEPATAEFSGMPLAAIETGAVQHVLPLEALAGRVRRLIMQGRSVASPRRATRRRVTVKEAR